MALIDSSILHLLVFLPLFAAAFITLVPSIDTASKLSISRFFATAISLVYLRLIWLVSQTSINPENIINFQVGNFNTSLTLMLSTEGIFLFGVTLLALMSKVYLFEVRDPKSNIRQIAPFLLTFLLFMSFGQSDIRICLPILSASIFLLYYITAYGSKARRGSTIFYMGIFLFSIDALALILLQIEPLFENTQETWLKSFILLIPGLSRMGLPMFAPFIKRLAHNLESEEGPFLHAFLQISGLSILLAIKSELTNIAEPLSLLVAATTLISAIYITLMAMSEEKKHVLPYFVQIFYSALVGTLIFFAPDQKLWPMTQALLFISLLGFFQTAKFSLLTTRTTMVNPLQLRMHSSWFISLSLMAGIPGFGIGAALWPLIYILVNRILQNPESPYFYLWISLTTLWALALMLFIFALISNVRRNDFRASTSNISRLGKRVSIKNSLLFSWVLVAIFSWVATFFAYRAMLI